MDNVIDATNLFDRPNGTKQKNSPLDRLRQTTRTDRADAALLATRLGEFAESLSPGRPQEIARLWFDQLWQGERWGKRKRFIIFPGEANSAPLAEHLYASTGADWASLIEQAAKSRFPEESSTSIKERALVARDMLRGTSFQPSANLTPLRAESAQSLLRLLTDKICGAIEAETDLTHLWEVLASTPFDIYHYDFAQPDYTGRESDHPMMVAMRAMDRYEGDAYSLGPLGDAAKLAADASQFRYRQWDSRGYRFELTSNRNDLDWHFPIIRIGLCGHHRTSRIFVIPQDFVAELPYDQQFEDEEKSLEDRIPEWLIAKGIVSADRLWEKLPEIKYDTELGYGWKAFDFELAQQIWLEVRPKDDGSIGLWVTIEAPDWNYCYPKLSGIDTLAIVPSRGDLLRFMPFPVNDMFYEHLQWPTSDPKFMIDGNIPIGGVSGLLDIPVNELPDIEGWLDDQENLELQDFLFRKRSDVRFCPFFSVDEDVPPPCETGTIAAAIFANAGSKLSDRIAKRFLEQAAIISTKGVAFHAALLAYHHQRIDRMLSD